MYESHCPICFEIYIEPILLPCQHCFCKPCFEEIVKKASLQCAVCRRRIGSWARLNRKNGTLINTERWDYIKKNFAAEVKARLKGEATPKRKGATPANSSNIRLAQTGEIKKEYEFELAKYRKEREEQEKASEKLIQQILADDERELIGGMAGENQVKEQQSGPVELAESAAFRRANKANRVVASNDGTLLLPLPKRSSSIDSITGEFNQHFKPIVRYPRTPPHQDSKNKGYPDTIKVPPGPKVVKKIDFSSPPEASSKRDKPLSDICNIPSTSSQWLSSTTASHNSNFILPLQSSVSFDDQYSNDSSSHLQLTHASSTNPSNSQSRLYIASGSNNSNNSTTGWTESDYTSSRGVETSPLESNCDTVSYRSDRSSPLNHRTSSAKKSRSRSGKYSMRSPTNSVKLNGHSNGSNGVLTHNTCGKSNGKHTGSRSSSNLSKNSTRSKRKTITESTVNNKKPRPLRWTPQSSSSCSSLDESVDRSNYLITQQCSNQDMSLDALYAAKLQRMYDLESTYRLNAIRCAGSGNEYNTRSRNGKKLN